ncbi:MAG: flippase [Solirubrobacteraceae bacterium]
MTDQSALSRRRLVVDVGVQIAGRLVSLALGVAVTLLIIRTLGGSGFGEWSTVLAITQLVTWIAEFGLSRVAVARAASHPEQEAEWLGALVALRVLLAVPATLACVVLVLVIATTSEMRLAGLLLSGTVLLAGPSAITAVFEVRVRNDVTTGLLVANNLLWTAVVVAFAVSDAGVVTLAAGMLAISLVTTVAGTWLGFRGANVTLRGSIGRWRELASAGLATGIAGGLTTAYVRIDQLLVFQFAGAKGAGLYAAVYRILDQGQLLPGSVTATMVPVIARTLQSAPRRAADLVQRTAEYLAIVSLPALAFAVVAAEPTVRLLFGAEFVPAAPALPILMGAFVFVSLGYLTGNLLVVLHLQRRMIGIAAAGLVVNVVLNVLLIPPYGFLAAAWVTLATEVVVFAIATRLVAAGLGHRPAVGRVLRSCAASAGMAGIVLAARAAGAPIGALLAIAALSYPVLLVALRGMSVAEVRGMLRKEAPT